MIKSMKEKFPLSFRVIQQIKAQEYERFFSKLPDYDLYMNHLGEIRWMRSTDAVKQHEFFHYSLSAWERLKRRFRLSKKIKFSKINSAERELRLHFRQYLEENFRGEKEPEIATALPKDWRYSLELDELENIPVSLDFGREEIWKKTALLGSVVLIILVLFSLWTIRIGKRESGKLLVRTPSVDGRVYLDGTSFLGYSNKIISRIPPGSHRISVVKRGYTAEPEFYDIEVLADSLVVVEFNFAPSESDLIGYLKIVAKYQDSKIFINDQYYGTLQDTHIFAVNAGQYDISIRKDGFLNVPPERTIEVVPGDTAIYNVLQVPAGSTGRDLATSYSEDVGSIEVLSNIKGALIIINGRDTGELTDNIFTQLPTGGYSVRVEKEGYRVEPESHNIKLSRSKPAGNAIFTLSAENEMVKIYTIPAKAKIVIDGELQASGQFEEMLSIGEHDISFEEIENYIKPKSRSIQVRAGFPLSITVYYFPQLQINAEINSRGNLINNNCVVLSGYTFKDRAFSASGEGGPSIEFHDKLEDYYWKLGYAFPYRNPKGNDAIKVEFDLPGNIDYDQKFKLKIYAASSREKYPLSLSTKVDIEIKLNNNVLSYYYTPKFIEDLGSIDMNDWDISSHVRGGLNVLEISTTEKNNTYYLLKKIEIFNE